MITDSQARNIVINRLDKNIFTNASAGAGKTTSLTSRIVSLVESGVDISSICTITFTKAAANEFYERLQALLSLRSEVGVVDRDGYLKTTDCESSKYCKQALQNIDLCFMGTIDAFTNKIVNEHPLENLVPARTTVVDDEKLDVLLSEIYVDIYNGKYDNEYPELKQLRSNYYKCIGGSKKDFISELKTILDNRNAKLIYKKQACISNHSEEVIKWFASEFIDCLNNNREVISSKIENLDDAILLRNKVLKAFNSNYSTVYKFIGKVKDISISYKKCVDKNIDNILNTYLDPPEGKGRNYKNDVLNDIYKEVKDYIISNVLELLEIASKIATPLLKKDGLLTFNGFLFTLRDTLKNDIINGHRIIDHIANKYKYFLLDESQDTSPIQTQVFFYINARNYSDDWKKCDPRPRSIFIVGDSKQSIYRFKGADVTAYMETEKLYKKIDNLSDIEKYDNIAVTLSKNFRSSLNLRKWYNEKFKSLLVEEENNPIHDDIDLSDPIKPGEDDATFNGVFTFQTERKTNASDVVSIIKSIVNNEKYKIVSKKDKTPRTINYKDIMIITKSKSFTDIIAKMSEEKIPYIAEGKTLFEDNEAVKLLKVLFRLLVKPSCKEYLFETLESPYCNLNDNDIVQIMNNMDLSVINYNGNSNINDKANNELLKLKELVNNTKYLSYSAKYEYLLNNIEIFKYVNIGELDLAYYVLEIIRSAEKDGKLTSEILAIDFINSINSSNANYERSLRLDTQKDSVKIANVHKVKGLQAPVVILSWSNYRSKNADHRMSFDPEEVYEPFKIFNLIIDSPNSEIEKNELESEKKRLEYVAATRAETVLLISYARTKSGNVSAGPWNELYSGDIPLFDDYEKVSEEELDEENLINEINTETDGINVNDLYNVRTCENKEAKENTYKLIKPSELKIDKRSILEDDTISENNVSYKDYDYTLYGTVIHRMMELIANSRNRITLDNIINNIKVEYNIDNKLEEVVKKVYERIQNGGCEQVNSSFTEDILNEFKNAKTILCEVPFAYMDGNNLYNGVMDLVYEDNNGLWHIIDYKTNKESDINKLEEEYKYQLDAYKKALYEIEKIEADAHIYHIDIH